MQTAACLFWKVSPFSIYIMLTWKKNILGSPHFHTARDGKLGGAWEWGYVPTHLTITVPLPNWFQLCVQEVMIAPYRVYVVPSATAPTLAGTLLFKPCSGSITDSSHCQFCTHIYKLASFPGPTQVSVARSTEKQWKNFSPFLSIFCLHGESLWTKLY